MCNGNVPCPAQINFEHKCSICNVCAMLRKGAVSKQTICSHNETAEQYLTYSHH